MKALAARSVIRDRSSKKTSRTEMVVLRDLFKIEQSWSEPVEEEALYLVLIFMPLTPKIFFHKVIPKTFPPIRAKVDFRSWMNMPRVQLTSPR
jgi:hypothetical protein